MIFNHNGIEKRKNKRRIILLGKNDHAIVMRKKKDTNETDVELYLSQDGDTIDESGKVIGMIFSNIFRQEFVDLIVAQIRATLEQIKNKGESG